MAIPSYMLHVQLGSPWSTRLSHRVAPGMNRPMRSILPSPRRWFPHALRGPYDPRLLAMTAKRGHEIHIYPVEDPKLPARVFRHASAGDLTRDLVDIESGWGERPSGTSPSMRKEVPPAASAASAPQKRGRSRHARKIRAAASVWEVEDAMTPWTHRSA